MAWSKLVDLALTDEERGSDMSPIAPEALPQYPSGCCLRLTKRELDKMDLDDDADVGDMIDLRAFGVVTSVHKIGEECCIEIQIQRIAVENEMTEEMDED